MIFLVCDSVVNLGFRASCRIVLVFVFVLVSLDIYLEAFALQWRRFGMMRRPEWFWQINYGAELEENEIRGASFWDGINCHVSFFLSFFFFAPSSEFPCPEAIHGSRYRLKPVSDSGK